MGGFLVCFCLGDTRNVNSYIFVCMGVDTTEWKFIGVD